MKSGVGRVAVEIPRSMALVNEVKRAVIRADALKHLCNEAHVLSLCASFEYQHLPALSTSEHVDESGHQVSF